MKTMPESINPERARRYLDRNYEKNRVIRPAAVAEYAENMRAGRFMHMPHGIVFDEHDFLLDGQHRLMAVIQSGCTVTMNVTRGAARETYRYQDNGLKRTMPDRIELMKDAKDNKACCQIVSAYIKFAASRRDKATVDEIETAYLTMDAAFEAVAIAFRIKTPLLIRAPVGAAIATYIHVDRLKGTFFLDSFVSGVNLTANSPVLVLRNALQHNRMDSPYDEYWKTISAIKAHRLGRSIKNLPTATEDLLGNSLTRLSHERSKISLRGAETRKRKRSSGAA